MASRAQQFDDLPIEVIEDALFSIPADQSREKWWRIGAALKSELQEGGKGLFHDWSRQATSYNERDCEDTWNSTAVGGGVNIATLIYEAQQHGFTFAEGRAKLDEAGQAERKREREAAAKLAEAEKRKRYAEAADIARATWDAAKPADTHSYLAAKGVAAHGLRVGDFPFPPKDGKQRPAMGGALIVPVCDARTGDLATLQGIAGNGGKYLLAGGAKRGGCHILGTPEAGAPLAVAEGYATAATIHELTGWATVCAFDAGNMPTVAGALRARFPEIEFVFCADNDAAGKKGAQSAARLTGGRVIVPGFAAGERGTDYNDLANQDRERARNQLLAGYKEMPIPKNESSGSDRNTPATGSKTTDEKYLADPAEKFKRKTKKTPVNDNGVNNNPFSMGLDTNSRGTPRATLDNFDKIMTNYGIVVRRNIIAKRDEYSIPGAVLSKDDPENDAWAEIKSRFNALDFPSGDFDQLLGRVVRRNEHNPVAKWITGTPWDGKPRLRALLDTITPAVDRKLPDGRSLRDVLMKRWLIGAVTAACHPNGLSGGCVLSFTGEQYLGKTTWARQLLPGDMAPLFKDGVQLDPTEKDSVTKAVSCFIAELGEIGGMTHKADRDALKAFITSAEDEIRQPYARRASRWIRRTAFLGTVNDHAFLVDPTGNRRFWTIECAAIDLAGQRALNMQQVWAEIHALWEAGETHFLTAEELAVLNDHNEDFTVADTIEERVRFKFNWEAPETLWREITATEVLIEAGIDRPTNAEASKAGAAVRKINGRKGRRTNGKTMLLVPPKTGDRWENDDWSRDPGPF